MHWPLYRTMAQTPFVQLDRHMDSGAGNVARFVLAWCHPRALILLLLALLQMTAAGVAEFSPSKLTTIFRVVVARETRCWCYRATQAVCALLVECGKH